MKVLLSVVAAFAMVPMAANAQVRVLDFEGIGDGAAVGNHYSGGAGKNHGVTFFGNALALEQVGYQSTDPCHGSSGFPTAPSGCGALFYYQNQLGGGAGMNLTAGFTRGFSLFYYPLYRTGNDVSLTVHSGANGGGTALATLALPQPAFGSSMVWQAIGVTFAGTAQSISFMNAGSTLIFDNVTFGNETPGLPEVETPVQVVPEPASMLLLGVGMGAIGVAVRRRTR